MKVFSKNVKNVADTFVTTSVTMYLSADEIGLIAFALSELEVKNAPETESLRADLQTQFDVL